MQNRPTPVTKNTWFNEGLGKLPPQAIELEEAVLGAALIEKNAATQLIDCLTVSDFYKESNQSVYMAIFNLLRDRQPVDLLTVPKQLERMGQLQAIGGAIRILELTNGVNTSANIEAHAAIVREMALKRRVISLSADLMKSAYDSTVDVFELLKQAEKGVYDLSGISGRVNSQTFYEQQVDAFKYHESIKDKAFVGIPSKYSGINKALGGLCERGNVTVIAARPSMGKSLYMVNEAIHQAELGYSVAMFSIEMRARQQVERAWALHTGILHERIRKGHYQNDRDELLAVQNTISYLGEKRFRVIDTPVIGYSEIWSECRKIKAAVGLDKVYIDYLGLMEMDSNRGQRVKAEQIAETTRGLKLMAKDLDVGVSELSQLSRKVEERPGDKKPILSDLRDSGSIEQDADTVLFLYRPEYYKITVDRNNQPTKDIVQVIIAKSRESALDEVSLTFQPKVSLIDNISYHTNQEPIPFAHIGSEPEF